MPSDPSLIRALCDRGVILHSPESSFVEDLDPQRFEPGVEIFPGCTLRGRQTLIGAGSRLGQAGGGYFENLRAGRQVELQGGLFQDCVILDGTRMRGQADVRKGSLIEEMGRAGQAVGYKMTVLLPFVVAGSLVNFADALVAGGSGADDFTELGSLLALYNYAPSGDKWASRFGDVPSGVFLRSPRIFVGGQARIVSPVRVGYGSVIAAGSSLRRDLAAGRLHGQPGPVLDQAYDPRAYGPLARKLEASADFIGQLHALLAWYGQVRLPFASSDRFHRALYGAAMHQLEAGVAERIARLDRLIKGIPASIAAHRASLEAAADPPTRTWHRARIEEQAAVVERWPALRPLLALPDPEPRGLEVRGPEVRGLEARDLEESGPESPGTPALASVAEAGPSPLDAIASALRAASGRPVSPSAGLTPNAPAYIAAIRRLPSEEVTAGRDHLQAIVDRCRISVAPAGPGGTEA